jgi:hypothetical protein
MSWKESMFSGESKRTRRLRVCIIYSVFLFFVASAAFNGYFSKTGFLDNVPRRSFVRIIEGTADRPFIYRQLLPVIANYADRVTPKAIPRKLATIRGDGGGRIYEKLFRSPIAQDPVYSFRYLVMYLEAYTGALVAVFALFFVCRSEGFQPPTALIASSLLILLIPYLQCRGGGYYTDFPEVAFLALAFLAVQRLHWLWLMPIAALGTFNKESFLLILLTLWPFLRLRWGKWYALFQLGILELVGASIYLAVKSHFKGNPGVPLEFHLYEQFTFFKYPPNLIAKFGDVYGFFVPEPMTIVPMAIFAWLLYRGWKGISLQIRQHAIIAACINVPLYVIFCNPGETRDFSMLYIFVLIALAVNLSETQAPGAQVPWKTTL